MEDKVKAFTDTDGMALARDRYAASTIREKQAAIEAGLEEMERGLERLGLRIEMCRERMAAKAPESLSLKGKFSKPKLWEHPI
jgi:hypothetical protein